MGNLATAATAGPDPIAALATDPAAANRKLKLLWIACGVDDTAMTGARNTHAALQKAGIEHTFLETPGAHHWRVWRGYLRDVAPLLFR
jgi:enterochelin esterase family protein